MPKTQMWGHFTPTLEHVRNPVGWMGCATSSTSHDHENDVPSKKKCRIMPHYAPHAAASRSRSACTPRGLRQVRLAAACRRRRMRHRTTRGGSRNGVHAVACSRPARARPAKTVVRLRVPGSTFLKVCMHRNKSRGRSRKTLRSAAASAMRRQLSEDDPSFC